MLKPITALTGPNETYKREHLQKILKGVPREETTVYFADETEPSVIFSQCGQDSLFGANNVVVVKNIDSLSDKQRGAFEDALEKYLSSPNPDAALVLFAEKFSAGLVSQIKEKGELLEFKKAYRNDLTAYIGRKFRENGIAFESDLPDFLVTLSGENSDDVEMMLSLLSHFAGQTKKITMDNARSLLSRSNNMGIFDLIEGLFKKDARKALNSLNDLRLAGEGLPRISYMLLRSAKHLWSFFSLKNPGEAQTALKVGYYEAKKLAEYARFCDMKFVSAVIAMVKKLEYRSKSMAEDLAYTELENFILLHSPAVVK